MPQVAHCRRPILAGLFCCPSELNCIYCDVAVLDKASEVLNLIGKEYELTTYRGVYDDPRFEVRLPVPGELSRDTTMLPPLQVLHKAGRPTKGKDPTKRIPSKAKTSASSSYNTRVGPASGTSPPASATSLGAPASSQGVPASSQGVPTLSQGVPASSQGGGGAVAGGVVSLVD